MGMDERKAGMSCQGSPEPVDHQEATVLVPRGAHVMGLVLGESCGNAGRDTPLSRLT